MYCINPAHGEEPLNLLCIDSACETPGLICSQCQLESHQKHSKIATKQFLVNLNDSLSHTCDRILVLSAAVDKVILTLRTTLYEAADGSPSKLQSVDTAIAAYSSSLHDKIKSTRIAIKKLCELQGNPCVSTFNTLFREHICALLVNQEDFTKLKVNLMESTVRRCLEEADKVKNGIEMSKNTPGASLARMLSLLTLKQEQNVKFQFSELNKGKSIKLLSSYSATMESASSERMLLMQPSLQSRGTSLNWKIKILKKKSWIGVGMCHLHLIKDVNFQFQYTETGHGNYLISSNGYSWSSLKPEHNSKSESFTFDTGDTIEIKFEPKLRTIEFLKMGTDKTFKLEFEFKVGDPLYPAVNLTGAGDSVEII